MLFLQPQLIIPKLNTEAGAKKLEHDFSLDQIQLISRIDGGSSLDDLSILLDRPLAELTSDVKVLVYLGVLLLFKRDKSSGALERLTLNPENAKKEDLPVLRPFFRKSSSFQVVLEVAAEKERSRAQIPASCSSFADEIGNVDSHSFEMSSMEDEPTIPSMQPMDPIAFHENNKREEPSDVWVADISISPPVADILSPIKLGAENSSAATFADLRTINSLLPVAVDSYDKASVGESLSSGDNHEFPYELVDSTLAEVKTILSHVSSGTPLPKSQEKALGQSVIKLMGFLNTTKTKNKESQARNSIIHTQMVKTLQTLPQEVVDDLIGTDSVSLDSLEASTFPFSRKKPSGLYHHTHLPKGSN